LTAAGAIFKRIQVELGPVATPFERRPTALEMALCQRYYQYNELQLAFTYRINNNESQRGFGIPIVPTMRAAPTVATTEDFLTINAITATPNFLWAHGTAAAVSSWARFVTIELDAELLS